MGVVTGTFVLPNGSPVANGAYQWKLSGDAIQFAVPSCDVPRLFSGSLDTNGNMTATFAFNDALSTSAGLTTTYQLTIKDSGGGQVWNESYYLTGTAANLNLIPPVGSGSVTVASNNTFLPLAQVGDIPRFNVNGDGQFDAVNYSQKQVVVFWDHGGGALNIYGANTNAVNHVGTQTNNNATTSDNWSLNLSAAASGSTSTVIGIDQGTGGNFGSYSWAGFYRWTHRFSAGNTTSVRYWMGFTQWSNGSTSVPLSTAAFVTNTPNQPVAGFRYSAGTDTAWQAYVGTTSSLFTVVSTGVAIDTNIHVFEFLPIIVSGALTGYNFFIDATLVATISTNLPSITNQAPIIFWCGDNQNTATAISGNFYGMYLALK